MQLLLLLVLAADPTFAVLTPGMHHGGEVKKPGQGWHGLFATKLAPVTLETKKVHDPITDDGKSETVMTGVEFSVKGDEQPLVFLKGLAPRDLTPLAFPPGGPLDKPLPLGDATLESVAVGKGHQLLLMQGANKQVLYEQAEGDTDGWMLRWAGDLDGDGKLDLIVAADHHYNLTTVRLFLSSKAKKGQLVREVAKFSTSGC